MFETYHSKLGRRQVHKLEELESGEKVTLDYMLLHMYNLATTQEIPVGTPPVYKRFNPEMITQLSDLFKRYICTSSAEFFLAEGRDVGGGLYVFADFQGDRNIGLYLTLRVCAMPFIGYGSEFYLGIYETPPAYDSIFLHGVPEFIDLDNNKSFRLATKRRRFGFFTRKTSEVAKGLFEELQGVLVQNNE